MTMFAANNPLFAPSPGLAQLLSQKQPDYGSMKQSPLQGLAAALGQIGSAYMAKKSYDKEMSGAKDTIKEAMGYSSPLPAQSQTYQDGTQINWNERPADMNKVAEILMGNPNTQGFGGSLLAEQLKEKLKNDGKFGSKWLQDMMFLTGRTDAFGNPVKDGKALIQDPMKAYSAGRDGLGKGRTMDYETQTVQNMPGYTGVLKQEEQSKEAGTQQARTDAITGYNTADTASKPLPQSAVDQINENIDAISSMGAISADMGGFINQIESGKLDLGVLSNAYASGANWVGASDEQTRNYQTLRANLERMRNESLRLNKGVQTEGDAVRAWNEAISSLNDPKIVVQRMREIQALNKRAAQIRATQTNNIETNYRRQPSNPMESFQQPSAVNLSQDEMSAQPQGNEYNLNGTVYIEDPSAPGGWRVKR